MKGQIFSFHGVCRQRSGFHFSHIMSLTSHARPFSSPPAHIKSLFLDKYKPSADKYKAREPSGSMGRVHSSQMDVTAAIAAATASTNLSSESQGSVPAAPTLLSSTLSLEQLKQAASEFLEKDEYKSALALYRSALLINPNDAEVLGWMSMALHLSGRQEAWDRAEEALAIDPYNNQALFVTLMLKMGREQYEECLPFSEKLVATYVENEDVSFALTLSLHAICLAAATRLEEAEQAINRCLSLNKEDVAPFYRELTVLRGSTLIGLNKYQDLRLLSESMLQEDRTWVEGHWFKALAALEEDRKSVVNEALSQVISLDPTHTRAVELKNKMDDAFKSKMKEYLQYAAFIAIGIFAAV